MDLDTFRVGISESYRYRNQQIGSNMFVTSEVDSVGASLLASGVKDLIMVSDPD